MLYVAIFAGPFNCYIIDQVSLAIPLLKWRNPSIIFNSQHHLVTRQPLGAQQQRLQQASIVLRFFTFLNDYLEELSLGMAHTILTNSELQIGALLESYPLIQMLW